MIYQYRSLEAERRQEELYQQWCKDNYLDPEDVGSMTRYEEWVERELEEGR